MPRPKGKERAKVRIMELPKEDTLGDSIQPSLQNNLQPDDGPEEETDYFQHVVDLTEKINNLRHIANKGRQVRRDDLMHTLNASSDEEDEIIFACILLGATPCHDDANEPSVLPTQGPGNSAQMTTLPDTVSSTMAPTGTGQTTMKHGIPNWANLMAATLADPNAALALLVNGVHPPPDEDSLPIFTDEATHKNGMEADSESLPEAITHMARKRIFVPLSLLTTASLDRIQLGLNLKFR